MFLNDDVTYRSARTCQPASQDLRLTEIRVTNPARGISYCSILENFDRRAYFQCPARFFKEEILLRAHRAKV
jgi:hypothetical protein